MVTLLKSPRVSSEAQAFCVGDEMAELLTLALSGKTGSLDFVTGYSEMITLKSLSLPARPPESDTISFY